MTNHWDDLKNAKVFLIEGSNVAENHVMAMKWIRLAQSNGAKVIHVDPRYNRTSAIAFRAVYPYSYWLPLASTIDVLLPKLSYP